MKPLEEIINKEHQPNSLQKLFTTPSKQESNEISIYRGELNTKAVIECIADIKKAFPALPAGFYEVFTRRLKENGFSDARLRDAVSHVIDTCQYPSPTVANFISFDRRIKILHYEDMLQKANELGKGFEKIYSKVRLPGMKRSVWILKTDVEQYKLESYELR